MGAKFFQRLASLSEADISAIIQMAWEDRTTFETIQERIGWSEADVIRLMRHQLQPNSFRLWRKRMKGRTTKHRALRNPEMKFDDRLVADHRRANCWYNFFGHTRYSTRSPRELWSALPKNASGGIDLIAFKINRYLRSEADENKDGKITVGGMQDYLPTQSSQHTMTLNQNRQRSQWVIQDGYWLQDNYQHERWVWNETATLCCIDDGLLGVLGKVGNDG